MRCIEVGIIKVSITKVGRLWGGINGEGMIR